MGSNSSGWNRPASNQPVKKGGAGGPSKWKGIAAGLAIVVPLIAVLCYFAFGPSSEAPKQDAEKEKEQGQIPEVTPAPPPKPKEEPKKVEPAKPAKPEKFVPPQLPDDMDPEERNALLRRAKWEWKLKNDMRLRKFLEEHPPVRATFKHPEEQLADWIFSTRVGDQPPPPLPQLQEFELNHVLDMLKSACEIKEGDDESVIERKKMVEDVKKEMLEYVKEGGTPQRFLDHYRNELVKAWKMKNLVAGEVDAALKEGDPDAAVQTLDKGNAILKKEGVSEVELTEDQLEQLKENLNKQKGQTK